MRIIISWLALRVAAALTVYIVVVLNVSASSYQPFRGAVVTRVQRGKDSYSETVQVDDWLSGGGRRLLAFGTYAAEFNSFEYAQCLRYYWPALRDLYGVEKSALLLNTKPEAAQLFAELLDLPPSIELWADNTGEVARQFNVSRGWIPDVDIHPFFKLLGMEPWGLGAEGTLPGIMKGYLGSPSGKQPWIQDAMAVGQRQGRWPDSLLELSDDGTTVLRNKFDEFPFPGSWGVRPFELATLRLQTVLGITLKYWDQLIPDGEALRSGVLTQLGGCLIVDQGSSIFEYRDTGYCAVADFESIIENIEQLDQKPTK